MSNVISLNVPHKKFNKPDRIADLIAAFAHQRRQSEDVFWLKENAELLNILECTGADLGDDALSTHWQFYENLEKRMEFFPQYYRFLLSICLDLEDLGLPGDKGERIAAWVSRQNLPATELSDLQRAEGQRLLARRGFCQGNDNTIRDRLHEFVNRSETFSMPNKKVAYELTHIVFYLSEYGRKSPELSEGAMISLEYAGLLAYLDQNADLLAEICIALRYAGSIPPSTWETWLEHETKRFFTDRTQGSPAQDEYHDYFVCNWAMATAGRDNFTLDYGGDRLCFHRNGTRSGPLRTISECMFHLEDARCDDWEVMRDVVAENLDDVGYDILRQAESSSNRFDSFFAGFARTALRQDRL